ncbi:MAG: hypothetical protein JSS89_04805 [Bacteroidetes bacterium]|nr:hypothetical protein [Bacteroidota bacterium]
MNEREISDPKYWHDGDPFQFAELNYLDAPYGIEFSPDESKVYVTAIQYNGIGDYVFYRDFNPDSARGELVQYDITKPTADEIKATRTVIVPMSYEQKLAGLQLGPDGKIYCAQRDQQFVSCIENPNALGTACTYVKEAVQLLPGTRCGEGFPFVMSTTLGGKLRVVSQDNCVGDTMSIPLAGSFVTDSVQWDFGDPSSPTNQGYGRIGRHYYTQPGAYFVTATMFIGSEAQAPVSNWVYVYATPTATASAAPSSICEGDTVLLKSTGGITALWYAGSDLTTPSIGRGTSLRVIASPPGRYTAIVQTAFGCLDTTSVLVDVLPAPTVQLTGDTTVCTAQTLTFTPLILNAVSYVWTSTPDDPSLLPSGPTASCTPRADAVYTLTVTGANGCKDFASMRVRVRALPAVVATGDTIICAPTPVQFSARGATLYIWSDAQGRQVGTGANITFTPQRSGIYVVTGVDSAGCENHDTVNVVIRPTVDLTISGDTILCDGTPSTWTCSVVPPGNEENIIWLDASNIRIGTGPTYTALFTTSSLLRATLPGASDCTDTASVMIHVGTRPPLSVHPMDTTACVGDSVKFIGSNGTVLRTMVQAGATSYPITAVDSVGCMTTVNVTARGVVGNDLTASFRDTTVDIGNGEGPIYIDLDVSPHLDNGWRGAMVLRLSYRSRSLSVARYIDASTGLDLSPVSTSTVADRTIVDLVIPAAQLHAPRQHLLDLRALPLVDQDTVSTIDVQIVSMEALAACVDTTSRSGLLTITGCGRAYYGHIVLGSPTAITVRPNPATETVFVDIDAGVQGEITVALVDALGRTIAEQNVLRTSHNRSSDHIVFDLTGVASGMHAVVITTPTERRYVQIVVGK